MNDWFDNNEVYLVALLLFLTVLQVGAVLILLIKALFGLSTSQLLLINGSGASITGVLLVLHGLLRERK